MSPQDLLTRSTKSEEKGRLSRTDEDTITTPAKTSISCWMEADMLDAYNAPVEGATGGAPVLPIARAVYASLFPTFSVDSRPRTMFPSY